MEKQVINITFIPVYIGKKYLVVIRDDISSQVKARAISNKEAKTITTFIQEDIIYRYSIFQRLVINSRGEFKSEVVDLLN